MYTSVRFGVYAILSILFMVIASEQSYQLDYATFDYKEGVTSFSAKLLLSVRSWREKLRKVFKKSSISLFSRIASRRYS